MSPVSAPQPSSPESAFVTLSKIMLGDRTLDETLNQVATITRDAVPGIDEVSVTMMDGDEVRTVVFTGPLASELDERQYAAGFGPCMDAARTGQTILLMTGGTNLAYPDFARQARRSGVSHVVSVGLPVPRRILGAVNMYATSSSPPTTSELEIAESLAAFAAVAVANATHFDSIANLDTRLQTALDSRNVIEQAKGVLMATHRYSAATAFATLLDNAHSQSRTVRDTAQSTVDGVQLEETA